MEDFEKEKKELQVKFIVITIVIALITAVVASEFTLIYYSGKLQIQKYDSSDNPNANIDSIAKNLKNIRAVIDKNFIGEIDEKKILEETIKGYVNGLNDEYSEYMTIDDLEDFQANALGNYVGIGIYMTTDKNNNVVILEAIDGTPAKEVGLEAGDIIAKVNDENVLGTSSELVSSKVKGEEGTKVKITVIRENEELDFDVERKAIKIYHVETKMLENNIGYIALSTFDEGCAEEFENGYNELKLQGAQKIIVDLRNNTGGLVNECLDIADLFLPKGAIELITKDSDDNKDISTAKKGITINEQVVILVNGYSASASEILVGALKDNGKATIVGTNTFGKGVIQSLIPLSDGSALKLTVNEYFTPNETKINKIGIKPDYEIEYNSETEEDEQLNKAIELLK